MDTLRGLWKWKVLWFGIVAFFGGFVCCLATAPFVMCGWLPTYVQFWGLYAVAIGFLPLMYGVFVAFMCPEY